jgi:D-alanine-D-alanine ligase
MSELFKTLPSSVRIAVLRGGKDPEYDLSLKTGAHVLRSLSETHNPLDVFISKDGKWHVQGVERPKERILNNVDVVFSSLHGNFGEDGEIQHILENSGVKFIGTRRYPSAIAINKYLSKDHLAPYGIKTPVHSLVRKGENVISKAKEIWNSLIHPFAVKPAKGGSAFGFTVVENFDELVSALNFLIQSHDAILVEEFIPGTSVSCLVTENFRGKDLYAFPTSVPLKQDQREIVEDVAKSVHELLNLSHYSQSDFIVNPKRGVYFLEVNTSPKIGPKSQANKAVESVGLTTNDFLHHLIRITLNE